VRERNHDVTRRERMPVAVCGPEVFSSIVSLHGGVMNRQQYRRTIVAAALALCSLSAGNALAARGAPSLGATNDSIENFTFGVCMGPDPSCYHNWGVNHNSTVLVYSRTAAERNGALGNPLPSGTNPPMDPTNIAQAGLKRILNAAGVTVNITESVGSIPGLGNAVGAVIFLDTSGDVLWDHGRSVNPTFAVSTTTSAFIDAAKVNLRQYMRSGGGFVGIHNGVGTERNWDWYVGLLGNASAYDSAATQVGTVQIEASDSSTDPIGGPGTQFAVVDSFYTLVPYPTKVKYLATVIESSLGTKKSVHPGHGIFHPVAWCQYYDGGRSWVTTLGQDPRVWADLSLPENQPGGANYFPGAAEFQKLIVNGVMSAMGLVPFCT
jgi:type 1 glutamine amidotransferase